jgi:hypothetical protein
MSRQLLHANTLSFSLTLLLTVLRINGDISSSWGTVFVPLFLVDGVSMVMYLKTACSASSGTPYIPVLVGLGFKILGEALLAERLQGRLSGGYRGVLAPFYVGLILFWIVLSGFMWVSRARHTR